jgi:16S rRNA A1518/A1519 N6-dimethyltransferase RsmA/KsgA/DIM1 with predicted DNA glycosylase/AP lyase activity
VVLLEPHHRDWEVDTVPLLRFLGRCFEHKRKTIRNNLAEYLRQGTGGRMAGSGIARRAIPIEDFVRMYARIAASGGDTE